MFRLIEEYLRIVDGAPGDDPRRLSRPAAGDRRRSSRLCSAARCRRCPATTTSCARTSSTTATALRIVDYELSGNNDPCFDLGNTAQEAEFDQDLRAALCAAYFGRENPQQLARMNLFALMSDVGWTLWGAIQAKISAVDFDFRGYYTMRWERAARGAGLGPPRRLDGPSQGLTPPNFKLTADPAGATVRAGISAAYRSGDAKGEESGFGFAGQAGQARHDASRRRRRQPCRGRTPETARSQSEAAYLRIRDRIVSLDMPPGSVVNEARLREELEIGRTPIREALQRLALENLVSRFPTAALS